MYLITLVIAFLQLTALAVGKAADPSSSVASTSVSANPNCPSTFQLVVLTTRFFNYYAQVNTTGQFNITSDPSAATTFTLKNNRLITLSSPGGVASVPKGTKEGGNYLRSTVDVIKYDFLNATFVDSCRVVLSKKVSATTTLDALYSVLGSIYLATPSQPPPVGFQIFAYAKAVNPAG